jgi:DNA topoisomerase-1
MPRIRREEYVGRECPECDDGQLVIKYGRWGKFIGCTNYPECKHTEPYLERTGITCPECGEEHGGEVVVRKTRKGRTFYGCSRYPDCEYSTWKLPGKQKTPEDGEAEPVQEEPAS